MMARAWAGLAPSSRASMITLNLVPPRRSSASRMAGARSSGSPGNAADAARAISSATSSAVLPLAWTAQLTEPTLARTASSPRRQRCADVSVGGGDDPAEHRGLAHSRGPGDHQHPPVQRSAIQPGDDLAQRHGPAAEPPAALAVDAHPARPRPPVPYPFGVARQSPAPLGSGRPRRRLPPTSWPAPPASDRASPGRPDAA